MEQVQCSNCKKNVDNTMEQVQCSNCKNVDNTNKKEYQKPILEQDRTYRYYIDPVDEYILKI